MKKLYLDTKEKIYRATSIIFIVQLFGALGAGFFFFVQKHINGGAANCSTPGFVIRQRVIFYTSIITGSIMGLRLVFL